MSESKENHGLAIGDAVKVLTAAKGTARGVVVGFKDDGLVLVRRVSGNTWAFHVSRVRYYTPRYVCP